MKGLEALKTFPKRLWSYQGDKVLIWREKIKDGRHDPNIFLKFLKNWCSQGIDTCIHHVENKVNRKSVFVDTRVTKVLIWRKKIKDGRHDPDIFPKFLKNWCRLGNTTTMQYLEY